MNPSVEACRAFQSCFAKGAFPAHLPVRRALSHPRVRLNISYSSSTQHPSARWLPPRHNPCTHANRHLIMTNTRALSTQPDTGSSDTSISQRFEELKAEDLSDNETKILSILETVILSGLADNNIPATASAALDNLCYELCFPPESRPEPDNSSLEEFLYYLWELLISLMKSVPHDHPKQDLTISFLSELHLRARTTVSIWGKESRLWRDLPLLSSFLREAWTDPSYTTDHPAPKAITEWLNLNAFTARLTTASLLDRPIYPLLELKAALEEESHSSPAIRDYRLLVASHWILLSGKHLFRDAFRGDSLSEDDLTATEPGPLYTGKPGLYMERWWFWLKRFEELSGDVDGEVRRAVERAVECMREVVREDGRVEVHRLGGDVDGDV
ncbi:hypothetical protein QBC34DRAFT_410245 [Podospora aff. communis PSN243]|uniref:Uncharacterized protein n=1 Tax=Podospora aff. communis PSN243 TaxID=3040156 RepID=A0AAV9GHS6_9PEZI|nr:hypothetical protein QBC34DRAFT_410245 [Podospora aff. communis PSN243]